jgi:ubiquinone/menaquinone biosynthesis C-methylase UbiE
MTNKLGLPFDYQEAPQFFDAFNEDSEARNSLVSSILKEHKSKKVLDLTCGTGSQVFYLLKHGFEVVGADFSPELLAIARKKATKAKMKARFIDGDMRTLEVGQFDAVITISNAVGHLTKTGFLKAMGNINKNLRIGGIYVFDIFNLEAMSDEAVGNLGWHIQKKVGDTHVHGLQCSTIDRCTGLLTSFDHIVLQKNALKPELKRHKFSLQIYKATELKEMLAQKSFEVISQYDWDGAKFNNKKSLNVVTVARKCA